MVPGVLPSISLATQPTASPFLSTRLVPFQTATTLGSFRTIPSPRTATRVLHVPRSMPMSTLTKPSRRSSRNKWCFASLRALCECRSRSGPSPRMDLQPVRGLHDRPNGTQEIMGHHPPLPVCTPHPGTLPRFRHPHARTDGSSETCRDDGPTGVRKGAGEAQCKGTPITRVHARTPPRNTARGGRRESRAGSTRAGRCLRMPALRRGPARRPRSSSAARSAGPGRIRGSRR